MREMDEECIFKMWKKAAREGPFPLSLFSRDHSRVSLALDAHTPPPPKQGE